MNVEPADPLTVLGRWHLDRTVEDRFAAQRLTVTGTLTLGGHPGDPDRIDWHEQGRLRRPGHPDSEVTRTLALRRRDGHGWWVHFEHGGAFHPWQPGSFVKHPCGADRYRGLVETDALPQAWTITWEVAGPAKDYTMMTRLTRLD